MNLRKCRKIADAIYLRAPFGIFLGVSCDSIDAREEDHQRLPTASNGVRSRVSNDVEAAGSHRKSRGRPVPRCESVPAYRSHNRQPGRSTRPDFTAESRRGRWSVARYRPRSIDARGTQACRYPLSAYARPIALLDPA